MHASLHSQTASGLWPELRSRRPTLHSLTGAAHGSKLVQMLVKIWSKNWSTGSVEASNLGVNHFESYPCECVANQSWADDQRMKHGNKPAGSEIGTGKTTWHQQICRLMVSFALRGSNFLEANKDFTKVPAGPKDLKGLMSNVKLKPQYSMVKKKKNMVSFSFFILTQLISRAFFSFLKYHPLFFRSIPTFNGFARSYPLVN